MPVIQICTVSIERVFLRSCDCCHKGLKRAMDKDPSRGCDCSSASLGATNKKTLASAPPRVQPVPCFVQDRLAPTFLVPHERQAGPGGRTRASGLERPQNDQR